MKWNELSMKEKSEAIKIAVSHNVYNLTPDLNSIILSVPVATSFEP